MFSRKPGFVECWFDTVAGSGGLSSGVFLMIGFEVVVQLITLPVEIDASFNKAMPILESGYLEPKQIPAAGRILRAAAWTYVAGSLASLVNFWCWLAVLKR